MISIENIYAPIILIIELLIFLYFEKKKIVIIKDESEAITGEELEELLV